MEYDRIYYLRSDKAVIPTIFNTYTLIRTSINQSVRQSTLYFILRDYCGMALVYKDMESNRAVGEAIGQTLILNSCNHVFPYYWLYSITFSPELCAFNYLEERAENRLIAFFSLVILVRKVSFLIVPLILVGADRNIYLNKHNNNSWCKCLTFYKEDRVDNKWSNHPEYKTIYLYNYF